MDSQSPSVNLHALEELERAVDLLSPSWGHDEVLSVLDAAVAVKQRACDLHERCLGLAMIWVTEHGPLVCGDIRWEARCAKKVTCRDLLATSEAILDRLDGDLGGLASHLHAQPFKYGACQRTLADDVFHRLFLTSFDNQLKLVKVDARFLAGLHPAEGVRHG